jgi:hypothetical protein
VDKSWGRSLEACELLFQKYPMPELLTFEQWLETPCGQYIQDRNAADEVMDNHILGLTSFFQYLSFIRCGKKVYEMSEPLCRKLLATSPEGIDTEVFRLPYHTILLQVPAKLLRYPGTEYSITSLFITEDFSLGARGLFVQYRHEGEEHAMIRGFGFPLGKIKLMDCVRQHHPYENVENGEKVQDTSSVQAVLELMNFIAVSILYITGANADVVWTDPISAGEAKLKRLGYKKRKILEQRIQRAGSARYVVGGHIVLTREQREFLGEVGVAGWKIKHQFTVQGHYRMQACGPQHSLRKQIFIEPFRKGRGFVEELSNPHEVR